MSIRMPEADLVKLKRWLWKNKREKPSSGIRRIVREYMQANGI
jgi:hypothetical protein